MPFGENAPDQHPDIHEEVPSSISTEQVISDDDEDRSTKLCNIRVAISAVGLVSVCLITAQNTELVRYISP